MSVQSEIDRINENVANTYSALSEMGATMPQQRNSNNLPGTVRTVPQGGGKTVQTDWNQTDETAPDFLKNKPFGSELEAIVSETEVVGEGADGEYLASGTFNGGLSDNQELVCAFDGVEYNCPCLGNEGGYVYYYGNGAFLGLEDNGIPFLLIITPSESAFEMLLPDAEPHSLSIYKATISKIDMKYVSGHHTTYYINAMLGNDVYLYTDVGCETKATKEGVLTAITKGPIVVVLSMYGNAIAAKSPLYVNGVNGDIADITVLHDIASGGNATYKTYHTAEYTG